MKIPVKVLHAPSVVGGNPSRLSHAETKLGLNSFCVSVVQTYFNYDVDLILDKGSRLKNLCSVLFWGVFKTLPFDVIHYNFGESFFPARAYSPTDKGLIKKLKYFCYLNLEFLDLKINHFRGKVIAVTYQGDDARQGDYCRSQYPIHFAHHVDPSYYPEKVDLWKRQRIKIVGDYADIIYSVNPDLLNVLPSIAKFLPYCGVDLEDWKPIWPKDERDFIPHIIHAPSNQKVKGTEFILDAVKRLKVEGIQFEFTLIEGLTNAEARKIYENADLLIDQLLAGFYGGLSVELMTLGKPSICYMREEDLKFLPVEMKKDIPIINATPETIYEVLKSWLTVNKYKIKERGMQSRLFVEKWHDPLKVAAIVKRDYEFFLKKKA